MDDEAEDNYQYGRDVLRDGRTFEDMLDLPYSDFPLFANTQYASGRTP